MGNEERIADVREDRRCGGGGRKEREIGQAMRPWAFHLVGDRAADGAAMLHEPPRAFECDRIALRAIGKADQLDDRARMLEEIAAYDALPGRPLGVKAKVIDTLGMEVGARERLEIGAVDDRKIGRALV